MLWQPPTVSMTELACFHAKGSWFFFFSRWRNSHVRSSKCWLAVKCCCFFHGQTQRGRLRGRESKKISNPILTESAITIKVLDTPEYDSVPLRTETSKYIPRFCTCVLIYKPSKKNVFKKEKITCIFANKTKQKIKCWFTCEQQANMLETPWLALNSNTRFPSTFFLTTLFPLH